MIIAVCALAGFIFGFFGGLFDDGPLEAIAFSFVGAIAGATLGIILVAIFNPAFFA